MQKGTIYKAVMLDFLWCLSTCGWASNSYFYDIQVNAMYLALYNVALSLKYYALCKTYSSLSLQHLQKYCGF